MTGFAMAPGAEPGRARTKFIVEVQRIKAG